MTNQNTTNKTKKRYFPSSFLVIICLMLVFVVASWIGDAAGNTIESVGILDIFPAIWKGFSSKVDVILFIFAIGGTLGIMTRVKAIDAGIDVIVKKLGDKILILIPVLMIIFGLGGTTYGMWEETIAFIPVLIPVFKKAGYGAFTAILVILIGAGVGCLASTINPFSTGAALEGINGSDDYKNASLVTLDLKFTDESAIKEILTPKQFEDLSSVDKLLYGDAISKIPVVTNAIGQGTRWVSFVIFEMVAIPLVVWTAMRIKNGKTKVIGLNNTLIEERFKEKENIKFTLKRKISLAIFIFSFILMIFFYLPWEDWVGQDNIANYEEDFGKKYLSWFATTDTASGYARFGQWYFISVSAIFLIAALLVFAINFNDFKSSKENAEEGMINTYMGGVKDMVSVSLLIGVAAGLGNILSDSKIGSSIANSIANEEMGLIGFGMLAFLISLFLSALVPSTSGFAAAFMSIFATIAVKSGLGMEGVSISILAFIFANGLANFFTPTSAALMGYTAYAGIPYNVWIKQTWKIQIALLITAVCVILLFAGINTHF